MRKPILIPAAAAALLLTACSSTSPNAYLGMMAGAEIGGTLGEAIGFMSTNRHDGPGKAMLGSVIGTVAGAAIGYELAQSAEQANTSAQTTTQVTSAPAPSPSPLAISNITYQDEDGDGKFARYETINVIYEVTNTSSKALATQLSIQVPQVDDDIALSPTTTATIEPGKTIRYKAKAFLKNTPKAKAIDIRVEAAPNEGTVASASITIPLAP